jgi:hypothetical protein
MKKLLLTALLAVPALFASAQNIHIISTDTTLTSNNFDEQHLTLMIRNQGLESMDISVHRTVNNLAPEHQSFFCFGQICNGPNQDDSPEIISMSPGQADSTFIGYIRPNDAEGVSTVKYCFFDVNGDERSCVTLVYSIGVLSVINESNQAFVKAFPNPAHDQMTILFNTGNYVSDATFMLTDITGRIVSQDKIQQLEGRIDIATANYANGIYVGTLFADGQVIAKEKLVIAH